MNNTIHVLDLSHWQTTPDFPELKDVGIVGVILKATEGLTNVDQTFKPRYKAALDAGLAVSSYHFLRAGSIANQMRHYLNILDPRMGERVCLDHEDESVSLDALKQAVTILQADPRKLQVTIYSGHVIEQQLGTRRDEQLATTSLWMADYNSTPTWPSATWPKWTLWQYSDKGSVPGVTGDVDVNTFNGSAEQCAKWFGPASVPKPSPIPDPAEPIMVDLTFPMESKVTIKVNGVFWMPNPRQ